MDDVDEHVQPLHVKHVQRAVIHCGSRSALIDKINRNLPTHETDEMYATKMNNILTRDKTLPAHYAESIERATEGEVTREQLRPDLYQLVDP